MHALDEATDYRPADTDVLARARGAWRRGRVTAWHRTRTGEWIAQVVWATGPPINSSCTDFLPASELRDARPCLACLVPASRRLAALRRGYSQTTPSWSRSSYQEYSGSEPL